ncbi:MAG TPA: WG repeat-containing protein [Candidatus Kapabacteria bacterium]|nr:WG repeat-containing protein [Candidatus Kapabacteria bacterium]
MVKFNFIMALTKYLIVCTAFVFISCKESIEIDNEIYPMKFANNHWGYINDNGDTIIKPIYDDAYFFEFGMAIIRKNDKFGIINKKNEIIIVPSYDYVCIYSERWLVGMINHQSYIHDMQKDTVYFYDYETAGIWNNKTLIMADINKKVFLLVIDSMKIIRTECDDIILPRKSFYYGEEEYSHKYSRFNNESINDNIGIIIKNNKVGYIKQTGEIIVEPKYDFAYFFQGNRGIFKLNNKWGIINEFGNEIITPKYDVIFQELKLTDDKINNISFQIKQKYYFLEKSYFENIPFHEGLARVNLKDKWGFIDTNGIEVVKPEYDYVDNFTDLYALVNYNNKYGIINKKGELIIPCEYKHLNSFYYGLSLYQDKNAYWFINIKREKVLGPYEFAKEFTYPETIVKINNKYGIIDISGRFLIKAKYDKIFGRFKDFYKFKCFSYFSRIDKKMGYINKNLKEVIKADNYDYVEDCENGIIIVGLNAKKGMVDSTGKEILKPSFDRIDYFYRDITTMENNGKYYYINKKGKIIFGPIKERARRLDLYQYLNHSELINYEE